MNKKGFTLAELLITLGIVGIIGAVTAPMVAGLFPDENKMKYLKAYNTLTNVTDEILSNPSLYWDVYNNTGTVITNTGLFSSGRPQIAPYNTDAHCEKWTKFPALFSYAVNLQGNPEYSGNSLNDTIVDFITTDGVQWHFDTNTISPGGMGNSAYRTDLTINVKPSDLNARRNCVFDNNNCKNPNRFLFRIENDGSIYPADAMGMSYIANSSKMNAKAEDRDFAARIVTTAGSSVNLAQLQEAFVLVTQNKTKTPSTHTH